MSNYTNENLITTTAPNNARAIKIGDKIFTGFYDSSPGADAYVVVNDNGTLKAQKLAFNGTTASDSGNPEILENVKIFNTGYPEPEGGGGNSMKYYKCASVDTTNHSWSGYEYDTELFIYSSTLTTGLIYSYNIPIIDHTYTEDALLEINPGIPSDPVLYFPLEQNSIDLVQGITATEVGTCNYITDQGIKCVSTGNESGLVASFTLSSMANPWTISCFVKSAVNEQLQYVCIVNFGRKVTNQAWAMCRVVYDINTVKFSDGEKWTNIQDIQISNWNHICITYDSTYIKSYLNGVLSTSHSRSFSNYSSEKISFAGYYQLTDDIITQALGNVKMSQLKLFNRALSQSEITAEYNRLQSMIQE